MTKPPIILVLNAGSSSLKYSLINLGNPAQRSAGLIARIGETDSTHTHQVNGTSSTSLLAISSHTQAVQRVFTSLSADNNFDPSSLIAIAHRVVHGGEHFSKPAIIDMHLMSTLRELTALAPLHNPANITGIEACQQQFPDIQQIAVFDTAFHQTLPAHAYRYAVPEYWYQDHAIRRYGFHGSSHAYILSATAEFLNKPPSECNLISLHLGNGASACAIANGVSVDTSMGMTPLEGLVMGSRCGDIDPGLLFYLQHLPGWSVETVEKALNNLSGLKGLCGENDMRLIHQRAEQGDLSAELARTLFAYRLKKYIGAYAAVLGRVDAVVFTGGIGENDSWIRATCLDNMQGFGLTIDPDCNKQATGPCARLNIEGAKIPVLRICTDEELQIARESYTHILLSLEKN